MSVRPCTLRLFHVLFWGRFVSEAALDTSALDQTLQLAIDSNGYETSDVGTETATGLTTRAAKASTSRRAQGQTKEGDPEPFFASAAEDAADNGGEIDSAELDHELWCVLSDSCCFSRQTFSYFP